MTGGPRKDFQSLIETKNLSEVNHRQFNLRLSESPTMKKFSKHIYGTDVTVDFFLMF